MDPAVLAGLSIIVLLVILFSRIPISYAMLAVGMAGLAIVIGPAQALDLTSSSLYRQLSSNTMVTIPLFILMGQVIFYSGVSQKLFHAAYNWLGSLPGGVAATTIAASMGFSAVSGSNAAGTATMATVALPEMKKYNYSRRLAGGSVAVGGIMGILMPPSTGLIIIAVQSQQSIATLFQAALVPSLFVGLLLFLTVLIVCRVKPELGPTAPRATWAERFRSLQGIIEIVVLFSVAIFGLLLGLFTPMEAGGVGALGAIVLGVLRRSLSWTNFLAALRETLRISSMVLLLVASAIVFGNFLSATRLPFEVAGWVSQLDIAPVFIVMIIVVIYLVGGAVMDALGFLVISIPLMFPLVQALGYDPIWFTVVVTFVTTIGAITPPVGMNLFITAGVSDWVDVLDVLRGVFPFFIPLGIALAIFIIFPGFILFFV